MVKNILYLDSKEAMDFFMKSEQYHGFELPEHLVFDELFKGNYCRYFLCGLSARQNVTRSVS